MSITGLVAYNSYASRDGSRAISGDALGGSSAPYRYFDASTNTVVVSNTAAYYDNAVYDRHATKAVVGSYLVDQNLALLGTLPTNTSIGDISPDGSRFYQLDSTLNQLRVYDLTTSSFPELTPVAVPDPLGSGIALDPRGQAAIVIGGSTFMVVDLR